MGLVLLGVLVAVPFLSSLLLAVLERLLIDAGFREGGVVEGFDLGVGCEKLIRVVVRMGGGFMHFGSVVLVLRVVPFLGFGTEMPQLRAIVFARLLIIARVGVRLSEMGCLFLRLGAVQEG